MSDQQASGNHFSAHTHTNPKEHCKAITTRGRKVVGSDVGKKLQVEKEVLNRKEGDNGKFVVKESGGEKNKRESVNTEKEKKSGGEEKESKRDEIPQIKSLPYPPNPSKKDSMHASLTYLKTTD